MEKENNIFPMEIHTMVNTEKGNLMERESIFGKIKLSIKVISIWVIEKEKE